MTDRVLLTGISGFLGGHVALALLDKGYTVRGSVRNLDRADEVRATLARHGADTTRLEFVALDLMSDEGWGDAVKGCRFVQHTASPFVISQPRDKMELIGPAVQGTERAINAALAAKVERIVLTSSFAAIGYGHGTGHDSPLDETVWTNIAGTGVTPYVESKTTAERRAWDLMTTASRKDDLAVINPSFILGPLLDQDPGTSGQLIARLLNGGIPAAPRLTMGCIDVRDVAAAHLCAMTAKQASGNRHLLVAGQMSLIDMARQLRSAFPTQGRRTPKFEMPDWAVRLYALFDADARSTLGELGAVADIDASRGRDLIGGSYIPATDALCAMARTLIEHGAVRA